MRKNNTNIHDDIASGILINVAKVMFERHQKVITVEEFFDVIKNYCEKYIIDVPKEIYLTEYLNVDLIEEGNKEIKFKYPYIHYYYTAKYLSINIDKEEVKHIITHMAQNLQDEEYADIMIFLCHLSKNDYIIHSVLSCANDILNEINEFDFNKFKSLRITFDKYIGQNFVPEVGIEERQEEILERKDRFEENKDKMNEDKEEMKKSSKETLEQMETLDGAYKSIEVMGQILKNYPGTIEGETKIGLLEEIHNLGMRTLTYAYNMLHSRIESALQEAKDIVYKKIQEENQKQIGALDEEKIYSVVKEGFEQINIQMDNLFGLMSYMTIRRLSNSVGNDTLKTLVLGGGNLDCLSYELLKYSTFLNEYGIIQCEKVISFYDRLLKEENVYAAKLLRLFVYEHYYVFGSQDIKTRQKIWSKMEFDTNQNKTIMLNSASSTIGL